MDTPIRTSWILIRGNIYSKLNVLFLPQDNFPGKFPSAHLPAVSGATFYTRAVWYMLIFFFKKLICICVHILKSRLGILKCVPVKPAWRCHRSVTLLWWLCRLCRTLLLMMPLVGTLAEANKHSRQLCQFFIDAAAGINYICLHKHPRILFFF